MAKQEESRHSEGVTIPKSLLALFGIALILVLGIAFFWFSRSGSGGSVLGQCRLVPYTDRVCDTTPLVYSKTGSTCSRGGLIGDWSVAECTINNLDSENGVFTVNIGVVVGGTNVGETQSFAIYPQTSHAFKYSVKADMSSCYCNEINIPTKQVCRDVIKTKQDCS